MQLISWLAVVAEVTGYQNLIPVMTNNTKDRHVLAAAVRERAAVIARQDVAGTQSESDRTAQISHPDEWHHRLSLIHI